VARRPQRRLRERVLAGGALLGVLLATGTAGYVLIEGWTPFEALYMTVTTMTTVGYMEVRPLSVAGRAFTLGLIAAGVGVLLYTLTNAVAFVVQGDLVAVLGERRMQGRIQQLRQHFVLCGFGRVGEEIAREFRERAVPFVVVDHTPEALQRAAAAGYLLAAGDATADATLLAAGVRRARGLIAASDSDAGNTFITLSAKALAPALYVVARVGTPANEPKLRQAGADRVISPYTLAGRRMALSAVQPFVVDFVDTLVRGRHGGVILAEVAVTADSALAGATLAAACRRAPGLTVLAVRRPDGRLTVGPPGHTVLAPGDELMVLGGEAELATLG
jgi:voltage-gated potassium channel